MKKILLLYLSIVFIFALVSCADERPQIKYEEADDKNSLSLEVLFEDGDFSSYHGTLGEFIDFIKGESGNDGKSAYELAVQLGYKGTREQWLKTLRGKDGKDGVDAISPTVEINSDGYWVINGEVTSVYAIGKDGTDASCEMMPNVKINAHGCWIIDGVDTTIKAVPKDGIDGLDGIGIKSIFLDADNSLIVILSNDTRINLGTVVPDNEIYTISFDSAGGSQVESQSVSNNTKISKPEDPRKFACIFDGWYYGDEKWNFSGCVATENMTLVARYTPCNHQDKNDDNICEICKWEFSIKYSDFGVVGDGITDDFAAIKAAHDYANENGFTVLGEKGKSYYIGKNTSTISIKTNVDWRGATFIIDDSYLTGSNTKKVFSIDPTIANRTLSSGTYFNALNTDTDGDGLVIKGVTHGSEQTKKLDLGLGYPALLNVTNSTSKTYIRWGYADGQVHTQQEIILIDADGNIDATTPFLHDYKKVTSITVQRLDNVEPITVKDATFISIATKIKGAGNITHNMYVCRPYTTLDGIKHKIVGEYTGTNYRNAGSRTPIRYNAETGVWDDVSNEGYSITGGGNNYTVYKDGKTYYGTDVTVMSGVTYTGFITLSFAESVTLKDCELQARVYYGSGTYDLSLYNSNNAKFINCIQTNFFDTSTHFLKTPSNTYPNLALCWGIMGSNYCKNLYFEGCKLTRFDAHCGVYNASMKDCDVALIRLIGGGKFTLDGVNFYFHQEGAPIQLREDYGASFNGTIEVKDCTIYTQHSKIAGLIATPTALWNFGYKTFFPNIVVDNLTLANGQTDFHIVSAITNQTYSKSDHYPERDPITQDVHDPNAKFTLYYETKKANIATSNAEIYSNLMGRTKVDISISQIPNMKDNEYAVIDHGNGTYTLVAHNYPNINPYYAPEFIEVKNMTDFKNKNGDKVTLRLYNSNFFDNTRIIDRDNVIVYTQVPQ